MTDRARRSVRVMTAGVVALFGILASSVWPTGGEAGGNYRAIFGKKYAAAEQFLKDHPRLAQDLRLPPEEAVIALAVVFPEIIRYSHLQDLIQVRALKVLYVQYGPKYADFSVGPFQMKPSFVEQLERDWNGLTKTEEKTAAGIPAFSAGDTSPVRRSRVLRLDDLRWQVDYLRVFMAVMQKRYGHIVFGGTEDRLRFYATAYNAGFAAGEEKIRRAMGERRFHLELFSPRTTYSYADVAAYFFRQRPSR